MKLSFLKLLTLSLAILISGCSSVQELGHWTSGNEATMKTQNILVIVKAKKPENRDAFEKQITKHLKAQNLNATSSYVQYPNLNPNDSLTETQLNDFKNILKKDGFNGIVYSRVIGVEKLSKTTTSGGNTAGTVIGGYFNGFNDVGFYGFYQTGLPSPSFQGVYQPVEYETETQKIYVLETDIFNLDLEGKEQLVASVTSKIDNVETGHRLAQDYAKTIIKALKK